MFKRKPKDDHKFEMRDFSRAQDGTEVAEKAGRVYNANIMASTPRGLMLAIQGHSRAFWFPKEYILIQLQGQPFDVVVWIPEWLMKKVR